MQDHTRYLTQKASLKGDDESKDLEHVQLSSDLPINLFTPFEHADRECQFGYFCNEERIAFPSHLNSDDKCFLKADDIDLALSLMEQRERVIQLYN